jgi:hypothetical protein
MKIKIKRLHKTLLLIAAFSIFFLPLFALGANVFGQGGIVYAQEEDDCEGTKLGVPLEDGTDCIPPGSSLENNPIFVYLRPVIQFLTAGAGLAIVIMIIISGIRYITSSGNPQAVQAAKSLLGKAIGALLLFIFMFALFNFLIPGGIIG